MFFNFIIYLNLKIPLEFLKENYMKNLQKKPGMTCPRSALLQLNRMHEARWVDPAAMQGARLLVVQDIHVE